MEESEREREREGKAICMGQVYLSNGLMMFSTGSILFAHGTPHILLGMCELCILTCFGTCITGRRRRSNRGSFLFVQSTILIAVEYVHMICSMIASVSSRNSHPHMRSYFTCSYFPISIIFPSAAYMPSYCRSSYNCKRRSMCCVRAIGCQKCQPLSLLNNGTIYLQS